MALPTYLELVNDVLVRLREPQVTTVNENALSKVVGKFVNDAKRQVEDAYIWNALTNTLTAQTVAGTFNYALNDIGNRFKVIEIYNNTTKHHLHPKSTFEMTQLFLAGTNVDRGDPQYYNFNGIDNNGNTQVDIYPIPDDQYQLFFNVYLPQESLTTDGDTLKVPAEPVVAAAYARALVERGEDGGLSSSEAYLLFKQILADYIAIESSRYIEEECWSAP